MSYFSEKRAAMNATVASWHIGRKLMYLLGFVMLLAILYAVVITNVNYSSGVRAGNVRKISKKGVIFKTYEGELQVGSAISASDISATGLGGNTWQFSVVNEPEVIAALERAAATGDRVSLHYHEKYIKMFWAGDTKYFVYKVEDVK